MHCQISWLQRFLIWVFFLLLLFFLSSRPASIAVKQDTWCLIAHWPETQRLVLDAVISVDLLNIQLQLATPNQKILKYLLVSSRFFSACCNNNFNFVCLLPLYSHCVVLTIISPLSQQFCSFGLYSCFHNNRFKSCLRVQYLAPLSCNFLLNNHSQTEL